MGDFRARWSRFADVLRDGPTFSVPGVSGVGPSARAATSTLLRPEEREAIFERETLNLFRRRTRLVILVAMLFLPLFTLVYALFAPQTAMLVAGVHLAMFVSCAGLFWALGRVQTLNAARAWSALTYLTFGVTAMLAMIVAQNRGINILSGHAQIVVSLLFVPFRFFDSCACALLIIASYLLGLQFGSSEAEGAAYWPRVLALVFTSLLMPIISRLLQNARRQAFDTAFDMALSAQQGAALSFLDAVTGGFNRRFFDLTLEREVERARRTGAPLSVLTFDLDKFKPVNDQLGHATGDQVLRIVWSATDAASRASDTVARYGGDEFALVLPETDEHEAQEVAERLQDAVAHALQRAFPPDHPGARVTLSVGLSTLDVRDLRAPDFNALALLARADASLLRAKRGGRNRIAA